MTRGAAKLFYIVVNDRMRTKWLGSILERRFLYAEMARCATINSVEALHPNLFDTDLGRLDALW